MIQNLYILFDLIEIQSDKFAEYLYNKTCDEKSEDNLFAYQDVIFAIVSTGMWFFTGLIISLILNYWIQYIFLCIGFIPLRIKCGGFHLDSHISCFFTMITINPTMSLLSKALTDYYNIIFIIAIGSVLFVVWKIPQKCESTFDFTIEEETQFRKVYCYTSLFFYVLIICLLYLLNKYDIEIIKIIVNSISSGIILSSLMLSKIFERILKFIWKSE